MCVVKQLGILQPPVFQNEFYGWIAEPTARAVELQIVLFLAFHSCVLDYGVLYSRTCPCPKMKYFTVVKCCTLMGSRAWIC